MRTVTRLSADGLGTRDVIKDLLLQCGYQTVERGNLLSVNDGRVKPWLIEFDAEGRFLKFGGELELTPPPAPPPRF